MAAPISQRTCPILLTALLMGCAGDLSRSAASNAIDRTWGAERRSIDTGFWGVPVTLNDLEREKASGRENITQVYRVLARLGYVAPAMTHSFNCGGPPTSCPQSSGYVRGPSVTHELLGDETLDSAHPVGFYRDSTFDDANEGGVEVILGTGVLDAVTGITKLVDGTEVAEFTYRYKPTTAGTALLNSGVDDQDVRGLKRVRKGTAVFRKYDDGWRLTGVSTNN